MTFVLPIQEHVAPHQLPLIAGLAVRNAVAELTGSQSIHLKWPNDILYEDRKLGGLLCERIDRADLVGLGLNVNLNIRKAPISLRESIASMIEISTEGIDLTTALARIAANLHRTWSRQSEHPFAALLQEYDAHHALIGREVRILPSVDGDGSTIHGRCEGLDEMGRLKVRQRSKLHHVISGLVQMF